MVCRVDFLASHFMTPILLQPSHGPVLSLALVSVSVTRFGKVASNPGATQYGLSQYTRCLKLLQSTLGSPKLTQDDATLGCAAVLGLFEVSVSYFLTYRYSHHPVLELQQRNILTAFSNPLSWHRAVAAVPRSGELPNSNFSSHP